FDLATGARWTLRMSPGRVPWWIFDAKRRVPDTGPLNYLKLVRLLRAEPDARVDDVVECNGPLHDRLLRPLLVAALNVQSCEGSAALAGAVIRETLALGGAA